MTDGQEDKGLVVGDMESARQSRRRRRDELSAGLVVADGEDRPENGALYLPAEPPRPPAPSVTLQVEGGQPSAGPATEGAGAIPDPWSLSIPYCIVIALVIILAVIWRSIRLSSRKKENEDV